MIVYEYVYYQKTVAAVIGTEVVAVVFVMEVVAVVFVMEVEDLIADIIANKQPSNRIQPEK